MHVPVMVLQAFQVCEPHSRVGFSVRRPFVFAHHLPSVPPSSDRSALYHYYLTLNCLLSSLTLNCMLSSLLNLSHDIRAPLPRRSLLT